MSKDVTVKGYLEKIITLTDYILISWWLLFDYSVGINHQL